MGLIQIVIILIVVGMLLWLAEKYIPIAEPVRTILRVFVGIVLVLWLLRLFVGDIPIGRLH
jgi:hypothetical protein